MDTERKTAVRRAAALLALGLVYLGLVSATFAAGIDLAADRTMQYVLHAAVAAGAFAYVFFADGVYRAEEAKGPARLALLFAAMFAVPVLIGRAVGTAAVASDELSAVMPYLNFYAATSVSRPIEMAAWTTLFPVSMLLLARVFAKGRTGKLLAALCVSAAVCCFMAVFSLVSAAAVFVWVGLLGWGVLFTVIVAVYIISRRAAKPGAVRR